MSKRTDTEKTDALATSDDAESVFEPETKATTPSANDPVIRSEEYVFADYRPGHERKLSMDIGHLFAKGFNPTPYAFRWLRYNELHTAAERYMTQVSPMLHGKWFKSDAFHKTYRAIVRGESYMNGEKPEFYLYVRTAEAEKAETQQMLKRCKEKLEPEDNNSEASNIINGIGKAIGTNHVGGGITRGSVTGWGQ